MCKAFECVSRNLAGYASHQSRTDEQARTEVASMAEKVVQTKYSDGVMSFALPQSLTLA